MKNALLYLAAAALVAAIIVGFAWLMGGRTRALFFRPTATATLAATSERQPAAGSPTSTALPRSGLEAEDIPNEEALVREAEELFDFIWIIDVHVLGDGSVWMASTIAAESVEYIHSLSDEELNAVLVPFWEWSMRHFGAAARNGTIYMAAWNMFTHDLRGVIVCEVATERCAFRPVTPPYPKLQPDDVEYDARVVP